MAGRSLQLTERRLANLTIAAPGSHRNQIQWIGLEVEEKNDRPAFPRRGTRDDLDRVVLREVDAGGFFAGQPSITNAATIQQTSMCKVIQRP